MKKTILLSFFCISFSLCALKTKQEFIALYNKNISHMAEKDKPGLKKIKDKVVSGSISPIDLKDFWFKAQAKTIDQLRLIAIQVLGPSGRGKVPSDITLGLTMIQKIMALSKLSR